MVHPAVVAGLVIIQTPYDTVFEQIRRLTPVTAAAVRGVVLRRDVMELRLDSGTAYVLSPVAGRTIGVAFLGAGAMSFEPPPGIERFQLNRVLGNSTVSSPITAAVLLFTDSTYAQLSRLLSFRGGGGGDPGGAIDEALEYLVDGRSHWVDPSLMTALLNGTSGPYFSAYVARRRGESLLMQLDPTEPEEVLLFRRGKMTGQRVETISQFQRLEDRARGITVASEQPEPLAVDAYDIDATIAGNYKFSARATVRLIVRRDEHEWTRLLLFDELDVDSVTTAAGTPLLFYRRDRTSALWVRFAGRARPGDTVAVRVVYHGDLIGFGSAMEGFLPPWWNAQRREILPVLDRWAFIKSTSTWYPRYSFRQSATFTLTFHTPAKLKFASIGRLVDSRTEGNVTTTRWVTELPTRQVSFNIGDFEQLEIRDPRIPPVTVHVNTEAHRTISRLFPHGRDPERMVGADVANSLAFFTRMFGAPLFQQYYATEIPYFHGQAFPGMIHLSWWTYVGMSTEGSDESFRAHEMAHQWWGIGVEPAGDRDAWLSEGFAEFAGLWYMQLILNDNDKYFKKLREARREIRRQREHAAPIGLGYRAAESWRGNYELVVYQKGAWVLHMLRNLMIDLRTMSEDRFAAMMRDFYETYRGKRASTLDFRRTVERHVGQDMEWFFDQWVYGTAVPTYTVSWTAAPGDSGLYNARVRVRQSDVPESFGMYVPVMFRFAEGEAWIRLVVKGAVTEATFALPASPQSIELNPLESVLAEVKTEEWREERNDGHP